MDFEGLMTRLRATREEHASGVREWVESSMTPFFGEAKFAGDRTLELDDGRRVSADRVFIATGARPSAPSIDGLDEVGYLTNETILERKVAPKRLVILGGGYIGCEFGYAFSAFGSSVTVIDHSGCLPREDREVRELFEAEFAKRVDLLLGWSVEGVERTDDGSVRVMIRGDDDTVQTVEGDELLVATGRQPNTDTLGLDAGSVDRDGAGYIKVDDHLETTAPGVYAYGDVVGQAMFKHTSSYEGELAYRNSQGADERVDYRANPHAVFTKPQVAAVGLTEEECAERGLEYDSASVPFASFAKGEILGEPAGVAKLITSKDGDRILGFHLAGPNAAVMIHEVVVAMNCGEAGAKVLREAIHVHPSAPELLRKVVGHV